MLWKLALKAKRIYTNNLYVILCYPDLEPSPRGQDSNAIIKLYIHFCYFFFLSLASVCNRAGALISWLLKLLLLFHNQ